ncbi:F1F0 ATP synthase assembly protein-like protein Atp11 [Venustampulla echinocandica]|uniref:F1F0 ATP synthase assembly protein-like protein Atp11 n=1 Tax=Venustampulla echinocandica TaxID=2656787 RepID=A0A370TN30_9HELO|nr:F1F0 ATP synthase assembly protein-like protein Atp11 [Venustampulla echinocandica]RDL36924.1 F1F0 ATP synthase assembly protein-like protein Atp11 [Venustampulla echinocandica]
MASFRIPALRHITLSTAPCLRVTQRRWARVHDIRCLGTQQPDRILDKYKEKLNRKAKEKGLQDINELKRAYQDKIDKLKKDASIEVPIPNVPSPSPDPASATSSSPFPPPPPAPRIPTEKAPTSTPAIKNLSSYLDLEKTRALPEKELEAIWRLRHAHDSQSLCAVIPLPVYKTFEATAKQYPHFVLPLPKEGHGAEIHFLQWTFPAPNTVTVLFTHLAEYKLRGEYSQPHTTITHHLELAEDKGVVMLLGQVTEGRGVSVDEAKWLVMCLQKFYGASGEKEERRRLLEMFGKGDAAFNIEDLLEEAEKAV